MEFFSLGNLSDTVLEHATRKAVRTECGAIAVAIAHIAEMDARGLFLKAGYPSMFQFCVDELYLSESAAYKRIHVGRAARRFPAIFRALEDGRLHMTAVLLLASHLNSDNACELLAAAEHMSKAKVLLLLAEWFPSPDLPIAIRPLVGHASPAPDHTPSLAPTVQACSLSTSSGEKPELALEQVAPSNERLPALRMEPPPPAPKPLSPGRFGIQFTLGKSAHDQMRYAQSLAGHALPPGDISALFEAALNAYVDKLEHERFAATEGPRGQQGKGVGRHVPAQVRREVWLRDGGQCTFIGDRGKRCSECRDIEFDHIVPFARGGLATTGNIRLLCAPHNQFEAEKLFGRGHMCRKRPAGASSAFDSTCQCYKSPPGARS